MKLFKSLNLPYLRKRQRPYDKPNYLTPIAISTLMGTYMDLYFTGAGAYSFPVRPMEGIFQINLIYNLAGLPAFTWLFLWAAKRMANNLRFVFITFLSMTGPFLEVFSEARGLFLHSVDWKHWYSFIGYFIFLYMIWMIFKWTNGEPSSEG